MDFQTKLIVIVGVTILVTLPPVVFYALNYSDSAKLSIDALNKDYAAVSYLGSHIRKDSYFGYMNYSKADGVPEVEITCKVRGDKRAGIVCLKFKIIKSQAMIDELIIRSDNDESIVYDSNKNNRLLRDKS